MNPTTVEPPVTVDAPAPVAAPDGSHPRVEPGVRLNVELVAWLVTLATAALLRLLDLGRAPLSPLEGPRARAALELARGSATPDWPGDLTSGLTAVLFKLLADSSTTARLAPALLGVAAVACLALYRSLIGRGAALIGAVLLAISPVAVATARALGPEAGALPLALLIPPLTAGVWLHGRVRRAPVLALVVGFGFGSGALVPAIMLVVGAWLAVERGWGAGGDSPEQGRAAHWSPALVALTVLALTPGLAFAAARYGGGMERVTLAAVRAWSGPPPVAAMPQTWHYLPEVLAVYEPLAFALSLAGVAACIRQWRRPASAGARLLLVWLVCGLLLALLWLHQEPGQLLVLTVPLALLGGAGTVRLARRLTGRGLARTALLLLPAVPALGFALAMAAGWVDDGLIRADELVAVLLILAGAVIAGAAVAIVVRAPVAAVALLASWVLLGTPTLNAASSIVHRDATEILNGQRTLPEVEAIARDLDGAGPAGVSVAVERRLWPSLAWPLRERAVVQFVETPPFVPAVVLLDRANTSDSGAARRGVIVGERWTPGRGDAPDILRWWLLRTPWGERTTIRADVVTE